MATRNPDADKAIRELSQTSKVTARKADAQKSLSEIQNIASEIQDLDFNEATPANLLRISAFLSRALTQVMSFQSSVSQITDQEKKEYSNILNGSLVVLRSGFSSVLEDITSAVGDIKTTIGQRKKLEQAQSSVEKQVANIDKILKPAIDSSVSLIEDLKSTIANKKDLDADSIDRLNSVLKDLDSKALVEVIADQKVSVQRMNKLDSVLSEVMSTLREVNVSVPEELEKQVDALVLDLTNKTKSAANLLTGAEKNFKEELEAAKDLLEREKDRISERHERELEEYKKKMKDSTLSRWADKFGFSQEEVSSYEEAQSDKRKNIFQRMSSLKLKDDANVFTKLLFDRDTTIQKVLADKIRNTDSNNSVFNFFKDKTGLQKSETERIDDQIKKLNEKVEQGNQDREEEKKRNEDADQAKQIEDSQRRRDQELAQESQRKVRDSLSEIQDQMLRQSEELQKIRFAEGEIKENLDDLDKGLAKMAKSGGGDSSGGLLGDALDMFTGKGGKGGALGKIGSKIPGLGKMGGFGGKALAFMGRNGGKLLGGLGSVLAVGMGAYNYLKAGSGQGRNEAIGSTGGSLAGAAAGAAIGSIVPGIGTVIGGAIGGFLGSSLGTSLADLWTDWKDKIPDEVKKQGNDAIISYIDNYSRPQLMQDGSKSQNEKTRTLQEMSDYATSLSESNDKRNFIYGVSDNAIIAEAQKKKEFKPLEVLKEKYPDLTPEVYESLRRKANIPLGENKMDATTRAQLEAPLVEGVTKEKKQKESGEKEESGVSTSGGKDEGGILGSIGSGISSMASSVGNTISNMFSGSSQVEQQQGDANAQVSAQISSEISPAVSKAFEKASGSVKEIIAKASQMIGIDNNLMMGIAYAESNFNPKAGAATSSAKGLYQFTGGTWKQMVKAYGAKYGLRPDGVFDPMQNSIAGALYVKENGAILKKAGFPMTAQNIYLAHFLGPGGAVKFLKGLSINPNAPAAAYVTPAAAKANKPIFTDKKAGGRLRTAAEVYALMAKKVGQTGSGIPASALKKADSTPASGGTAPSGGGGGAVAGGGSATSAKSAAAPSGGGGGAVAGGGSATSVSSATASAVSSSKSSGGGSSTPAISAASVSVPSAPSPAPASAQKKAPEQNQDGQMFSVILTKLDNILKAVASSGNKSDGKNFWESEESSGNLMDGLQRASVLSGNTQRG